MFGMVCLEEAIKLSPGLNGAKIRAVWDVLRPGGDGAIVAWQEVPGTASQKSRPVGYGVIRTDVRRFNDWSDEMAKTKTEKRYVGRLFQETLHCIEEQPGNIIGHQPFKKSISLSKYSAPFDENTSGISCARSYRTLRDGAFEGTPQALRARLRSHRPSGTKNIQTALILVPFYLYRH